MRLLFTQRGLARGALLRQAKPGGNALRARPWGGRGMWWANEVSLPRPARPPLRASAPYGNGGSPGPDVLSPLKMCIDEHSGFEHFDPTVSRDFQKMFVAAGYGFRVACESAGYELVVVRI